MLNDEIKKKRIKNDSSKLDLTCQNHDPSYKSRVISWD
jgi:hypothetical protein